GKRSWRPAQRERGCCRLSRCHRRRALTAAFITNHVSSGRVASSTLNTCVPWAHHGTVLQGGKKLVKRIHSVYIAALLALALIAGCARSSTPATTTENNANGSDNSAGGTASNAKSSGLKPAAEEIMVIPAGTTLMVRLGDTLSSKESHSGDSFSATVARPVEVNGKTIIDQ